MTDTPILDAAPSAEAAEANRDHQTMIDSVLFKRNLDEVFLLLDFVSGRSDKELSRLTIADPYSGAALTAQAVVARLADIRYPPDPKTAKRSADAAFLLLAKDALTSLAAPAKGMTIAYTSLFSGVESMHDLGRWFGFARRGERRSGDNTRGALAEAPFPACPDRCRSSTSSSACC